MMIPPCACLLAAIFSVSIVAGSPEKMNVLFIVADDLRPMLGCYGAGQMVTPNIDQLASKSLLFDNAYVQQALCGPSRTSFLTSRRPDTTRLYDFYSYWRKVAGNYTTLPQYFKEQGYWTASVGKVFHPGKCAPHGDYPYSWSVEPYIPPTHHFMNAKTCPGPDGKLYENLVCPIANISSQPGHSLPDIQNTQQAIKLLRQVSRGQHGDKPFFLAVGFYKPHIPLRYPAKYKDLYPLDTIHLAPNPTLPPGMPKVAWNPWTDIRERHDIATLNVSFPFGPLPKYNQRLIRQSYFAAISYVDDLLGELLAELDKLGLAHNTVISLVGDHGWALGEHQEFCKYSTFEVAVNVPLMFSIPNVTHTIARAGTTFKHIDPFQTRTHSKPKAYRRSSALVELVDMFPTLADVVGFKVPEQCPVPSNGVDLCTEGVSLKPIIYNETLGVAPKFKQWKNATFSQYPRPSVYPQENSDSPLLKDIKIMGYTMRTENYRYTEWVRFNHTAWHGNWDKVYAKELYLHKSDSQEDDNRAYDSTYSHLVAEASKLLHLGWTKALPTY